jgi:molybdopterin synthase sulfur carrier subunit
MTPHPERTEGLLRFNMATVSFTPNIQRHVQCPSSRVDGDTVRQVLDAVFKGNPRARGYVLDDQGAVRSHMVVFVDGRQVRDRQHLSDPVRQNAEVYVAQALSGG